MKRTLREGLQVFELHERHTLTQGRQALLDIAGRLPQVLASYYDSVAGQL
jgi:hypothetical protein